MVYYEQGTLWVCCRIDCWGIFTGRCDESFADGTSATGVSNDAGLGGKDHYVKPAALASMVTQMSQGQVELDWANGGREALLRSDDPKDKQGVLDQPIAFVDLEQQNAIKRITRQYERSAAAQTALRALDDLHIKILVTPMRIIAQ